MIRKVYEIEFLTPCFCAGADPTRAELRAPAIRGQLRWWFRVLGGFASLNPQPLREQESCIFGTAAGDEGKASPLSLRVAEVSLDRGKKDFHELLAKLNLSESEGLKYLLFPFVSKKKQGNMVEYRGRGVIIKGSFKLYVSWTGPTHMWQDIEALITVWGHLGALGARSRRALGAIAIKHPQTDLKKALERFSDLTDRLLIKEIARTNLDSGEQTVLQLESVWDCVSVLADWLKSWREHGRSPNLAIHQPGFRWARRDHNEGFKFLTGHPVTRNPPGHPPHGEDGEAFRPALGLPIVQYFHSCKDTVYWDYNWLKQSGEPKPSGRFASPILLRPYRDNAGKWHALVMFVEAYRYDKSRKYDGLEPFEVVVSKKNGSKRRCSTWRVNLGLYKAMLNDERLEPFRLGHFAGGPEDSAVS